MSRLILYLREASPPSNAVKMLAEIIGLQYDVYEPDLLALEHKSPNYRKKNPMGTIPVMEDGSFILSESHAIMKYLLSEYGGEHREILYPSDVKSRAVIDERMYFDAGVFFIKLKDVALPTLLQGLKGPTRENINGIEEAYSTLEMYLSQSQYVATDRLTLADLSCGSTAAAMQPIHKLDAKKYPRCNEWMQRLEEKPYFSKINSHGALVFGKLLNHFWRKNKQV